MTDNSPQLPLDDDTDTTVPHSARIWNYWLGGRLNYPVDRAAGEAYQKVYPQIVDVALASRAFQTRTVRFLAGEAGLTQFLDVGAGLPAVENTHEIAQGIEPSARVLYVDHDPFVVKHGRGQLTSTAAGSAGFIEGICTLVAGLPAGSYLALQDGTSSGTEAFDEAQDEYDDTGALPYHLRRPEQVAAFFDGLGLVEPGVVPLPQWRPDPGQPGPAEVPNVGGVGRKA